MWVLSLLQHAKCWASRTWMRTWMAKKTDIPILGVDMCLDVFALVRLRLEQIPSTLLYGNMGYIEYESVYSCFLALVSCEQQPYHSQEPPRVDSRRLTWKKAKHHQARILSRAGNRWHGSLPNSEAKEEGAHCFLRVCRRWSTPWEKFRIPTIQKPPQKGHFGDIFGGFLQSMQSVRLTTCLPKKSEKTWTRVLQNPDATESICLKTPLLQMCLQAKEDNQQYSCKCPKIRSLDSRLVFFSPEIRLMFLPPKICKKIHLHPVRWFSWGSAKITCQSVYPRGFSTVKQRGKKKCATSLFGAAVFFWWFVAELVNGISSLQHRCFHGQVSCCALVIHQNSTSQDTTSSWPDRRNTCYEDIWSNMVFVASLGTDVVWSSDQTDWSLGTNCKKRIPPKMTYV